MENPAALRRGFAFVFPARDLESAPSFAPVTSWQQPREFLSTTCAAA
jgi:hypothetical protein